ncbi:MAG TPA: UvrD-helicase domain-containing protein [Candidatus Fermentibacter daniensis]|nr:UvrD-helicase domain-containing protein [Candidatus Fermentibacter daniensis]
MYRAGLNPEQAEAVVYLGGHLLVLAGAGSGKTRVLTCRIAHLLAERIVEPRRILAVTFTNKAAGEMKERVGRLSPADAERVRMGTFHSICAWILRREASSGGWPENFSIYDADDQKSLLRSLLKNTPIESKVTPGAAQTWISRWKNSMVDPGEAENSAESDQEREIARLYAAYQSALRRNGAFDFDDLLTVVHGYIRQETDAGSRYSRMFGHILVDEYQDTNLVQRGILKSLGGPGSSVCAVGDDDQSIYGWRGARVSNILDFPEDFPGTRIIRLERNYRSTPAILAAASSLVSFNRGRHGKALWTERPAGEPVRARSLANPEDEAAWILKEVSDLSSRGVSPGRVAVLYRTNAQSRVFESAALLEGIPCQVIGSLRFYEREEIKDIVAWLRVLANPGDRISLARVLNKPPRGIGDKSKALFLAGLDASGADPSEFMKRAGRIPGLSRGSISSLEALGSFLAGASALAAGGAPAAEVVDAVLAGSGMLDALDPSTVEGSSRLENIDEFRRSANEYDSLHPGSGLAGFLTTISLMTTSDAYDSGADRLSLMTLHCAKGLEFDTVFIAGVEEGLIPFIRAGRFGPDDLEEERRLLYVGMTRAKDRLYLTWAERRARPGVTAGGVSRFVSEVSLDSGSTVPAPAAAVPDPVIGVPDTRFSRGNVIHHPRYGMGTVLKAVRRGGEWQLTIDFGMDEPKTLLTGYVPITIVREKGGFPVDAV